MNNAVLYEKKEGVAIVTLNRPERLNAVNDEIRAGLREKLDAKKIAVVSHSSFLGQYLFKKIGDEHNELEHCHPFGPYSINRYKL